MKQKDIWPTWPTRYVTLLAIFSYSLALYMALIITIIFNPQYWWSQGIWYTRCSAIAERLRCRVHY